MRLSTMRGEALTAMLKAKKTDATISKKYRV